MYTISQASVRSGVGAPLIRAWERRYGVVRPSRTTSGYRLYDDEAIAVLRAMRSLIGSGWTASEAARAIGAGEIPLDAPAPPPSPGSPAGGGVRGAHVARAAVARVPTDARAPDVDGETARASRRTELLERFVSAAASSSPADTEAVLDEILGAGSFESVVDDLLLPAAAALGDAWARGILSVAAEHAASAAVVRRLGAVYQAAGVPGRPSVVVGLPPGSRHEIGALAFAAALRRLGVGVLYLGADVPVDAWAEVVGRTRARVAVVGVVTAADRPAALAVIEALRARGVPTVVAGGAASDDIGRDIGVVPVPPRIVDAARLVAATVRRRA